MIDGQKFFDKPLKNDQTLKSLQLVKEIITQPVVY